MNALLLVCGLGFISLLAEITNWKKYLHVAIIAGIVAAALALSMDWNSTRLYFNKMLIFDPFSLAFTALILGTSLFWFLMSSRYFVGNPHQTDRSALILFTIAGGIMMVSFHNMAMLFLGVEILSISLYVLAGSNKESFISNEAAFKYFIMGSFATGFLLMGIALVYGATGSFDIGEISRNVRENQSGLPGFFYVGMFLMLIGMSFKISAVPFHFWAPDVYSGSPTSITAFMSTVVKIAAIGAFYKLFGQCFLAVQESIGTVMQIIIVLTLIVSNVTAVYQSNIKRMLAYSSIAHVGYVLLAFISGGVRPEGVVFYYLFSYSIASLVAFGIVSILENTHGSASLASFQGMFHKAPLVATCLTVVLLSLAGIPPLAGFFAKYIVLGSAIDAGHVYLAILAVVTSLIGIVYYFRPIITMFSPAEPSSNLNFSSAQKIVIFMLTVLTLLAGLFPDVLIRITEEF
jgi:NADH-quinone oxidoreductase subunit N